MVAFLLFAGIELFVEDYRAAAIVRQDRTAAFALS
jgi:hypothetical protein